MMRSMTDGLQKVYDASLMHPTRMHLTALFFAKIVLGNGVRFKFHNVRPGSKPTLQIKPSHTPHANCNCTSCRGSRRSYKKHRSHRALR